MEDNALIETRQQGVQIALPYFKRLNKLASFVSTIELTVTKKTVTTLSLLTMITSLQTITKSNTFYIQRCTPFPFPFSQCNQQTNY